MRCPQRSCFWDIVAAVIGCWFLLTATVQAQSTIYLAGAGSSLVATVFSAWTNDFNRKNSTIQAGYFPLNSAEAINQIKAHSADFGDGEIPLTPQQIHDSKVPLTQIPILLVGIVPIYNVPGNPDLRFSGKLLAEIYLGSITSWNDPRIEKMNPGVRLPDLRIQVIHRTQGSGTNYIFSDFLSKASPEFHARVGKSPSPHWPVGKAATSSVNALEIVKSSAGAIAYVDLSFAVRSNVVYGSVQNSAGKFIKAVPEAIASACVARESQIATDFGASLADAPASDAYPVVGFNFAYVRASGLSPERTRALKQFLSWALGDGQQMASGLGYTPLPQNIASQAEAKLMSIQ
jgi:phosphate transport system substrate-binding protein